LKTNVKKLKHQKVETKIKGIKQSRETHAKLVNLLKSFKDRVDLEDDEEQVEKYSKEIKQYQVIFLLTKTALN
jgi:hypothetical protein